jgi:hypothetical protein
MDKLNLTELKALAKEEGVKGYSTMTKPALLSHLSGGAMLGGSSKFESLNVDQLRGYIKGKTGVSVAKVKKEDLVQMAKGKKDVPEKPKRTGNAWVEALKVYNKNNAVWVIPSKEKNPIEHEKVKKIMKGESLDDVMYVEAVQPKKTRKTRKAIV